MAKKRITKLALASRTRVQITRNGAQLDVKLSRQDADLARLPWGPHTSGYAYHRCAADDNGYRPVLWLHKMVAARMNGGVVPRWVRFKNGARLDCRRGNLKIFLY